jgi:hypothetical protein
MGKSRKTASGPSGTDPVSYTVSGKWIKITRKVPFSSPPPEEFPFLIESGSAVSPATIGNPALICTQIARNTARLMGRETREAEFLSYTSMYLIQVRFDLIEVQEDTLRAQIKGRADQIRYFFAVKTLRHVNVPAEISSPLNPQI